MPESLTLSHSLHPSCSIYPKIELRAIGQHHTEHPRQWVADRHVAANKGEVIMITTNGMVEVSRTLLLAHIDYFVPKTSFRTMVILTRSTSISSYSIPEYPCGEPTWNNHYLHGHACSLRRRCQSYPPLLLEPIKCSH